jgi:K(+)-stimulated pyrophosphate-energized sodium pump
MFQYIVPVIFGGGAIAVLYSLFQIRQILSLPSGDAKMQSIAQAILEGANAYLKRQYMVISIVALPIVVLLGLVFGINAAATFLIGAVLSAASGIIGMSVSVRTNSRTAEAAKSGLKEALKVAFSGGSVTGLMVAGLALIAVAVAILIPGGNERLVSLGFGASLISIFARIGGGIFTKAADVGTDMVGKIEANIPEDDPRNPGVIADNVGDNVGDCAGMAADLFETYVVTMVATILLGNLVMPHFPQAVLPPTERRAGSNGNQTLHQLFLLVAFQRDNFLVFPLRYTFLIPELNARKVANSGLFCLFLEPLSTVFDQNLSRINGDF